VINVKGTLDTMKKLSIIAGKEILKLYKKEIAIEYKDDKSPVTDADKKADDIIVRGLKDKFPEIPVLSEESSDDYSRLGERYCFVVDPLDGTKEFINRNDEFTVNIALTECGLPVLGVIYVPVYDELYHAAKSLGAWSFINGREERLFVSQRTKDIRLAKSRFHHTPELDKLIAANRIKNVIVAGSAYKGCLLARGDVEVYYRFGKTMEWDTAAMDIIVTEAGGFFSGIDGKDFIYNKKNPENPTGFYALNKKENALKLVKG
jgi:3'(2'), 5'-bisphosphate nucleotidase